METKGDFNFNVHTSTRWNNILIHTNLHHKYMKIIIKDRAKPNDFCINICLNVYG